MISVIIPVYNEANYLEKCINAILDQNESYEIIIVDGSSTDNTLKKIPQNKKIRVLISRKGRALQCNRGAREASGDVLLFLHADCILPKQAFELIATQEAIGGGFFQQFAENHLGLRLVSLRSNVRARFFKIFFGDQAIFVRKEVFEELNGFKAIPIMEDLEFAARLKKKGKLTVIKEKVTVSGRSYLETGILKLSVVYAWLMLLYHCGVSFEKLKKSHDALLHAKRYTNPSKAASN